MAEEETSPRASRLTARGAATRARITSAAVELMFARGVNATTLDDVMAASGTSKSQLYQHFPNKEALVKEVIAVQARVVLERHGLLLKQVNSLRGLQRWRDATVQLVAARRGAHGCELGSLASELADQDEDTRAVLARYFQRWEKLLAEALGRLQDRGILSRQAEADVLATGMLAALQGGYLLAQTAGDADPMRIALDMAMDRVGSYVVSQPARSS